MMSVLQRVRMVALGRVVLVVTLVVLVVGASVVYKRFRTPTASAVTVIDRWANAAAGGDLVTARDLLVDDPIQRAAFDNRWPSIVQVYGIVPGHAVSNVVQQGRTTTATVHFRTADAPMCMEVQVDDQQRLSILQQVGTCAWPPTSEQAR